MNTLKRLEHLEHLLDGLHRGAVTAYFDNGDVARMPLEELIPLLRQDSGITHISDIETSGNGVVVDLLNDLLEGKKDE